MQYDKQALNCEIISRTINLKLSIFKCVLIGPGNKNLYLQWPCLTKHDCFLLFNFQNQQSEEMIHELMRYFVLKNPICKPKIKLKCHFNISDIWSTIRKWSNYESRKNISVNLNWKSCLVNIIFWQALFYHTSVAVITLQFIL